MNVTHNCMTGRPEVIVDALEQAWQGWAELGTNLDEQQWNQPTRLDGWNVKNVYAHVSDFPALAAAASGAPAADAPLTHGTAADLLAFMQQPGGVADTSAEHLRQKGLEVADARSTAELAEQFTTVAPHAIAGLRELDLARHIDYFGLAVVPQAEGLRIFLMEAVVHYFDMATALDLPTPGPMAGEPVRATAQLLSALADPVALIDAATGRGTPPVFPVMH